MDEYIIILLFLVWYVLSLIVSETIGKKKKLGIQMIFFICMMFSPLIGYIIARVSPNALQIVK
jgi:hypothetical protein